jgi:hypothetical protein
MISNFYPGNAGVLSRSFAGSAPPFRAEKPGFDLGPRLL